MNNSPDMIELDPAATRLPRPDRCKFCHLPLSYQILIWAARMWTNDQIQPAERWATIRTAFSKINAPDATVPFLRLMEVIQAGARCPILIGEGGCPVFPDEIRFVECIAASVHDLNSADATCSREPRCARHNTNFHRMLAPGAARIAAGLVADIGRELTNAGLRFPRVLVLSQSYKLPIGTTLH